MNVRICNEMLDLCGEMETNLENWAKNIDENSDCSKEQLQQIQNERQALDDIQGAIMKYFRVRDEFNREFEVVKKSPEKKGLFGRDNSKMVVQRKAK